MAADTSSTTVTAVIAALAAFVGACIGAAALLRTNTRNIKVENVTKERAKWRDKVRKQSLAIRQAAILGDAGALADHQLIFKLILNPLDKEDRAILSLIQELGLKADERKLTEFGDRIALLLKHDWQRAKWEAEDKGFFASEMDGEPEPRRVTYEQFKRDPDQK